MSEKRLYVEGGGDSKELQARCREGFRKLLEKGGFVGRVPRIVACGSRNATFNDFETAHKSGKFDYVALIVDSEDAVTDGERTWAHLVARDQWKCPDGATDEQVFLMTTCMETWIVADRAALKRHFKNCLQESALPAATNFEERDRHAVQEALTRATRNCTNAYAKNKRSFDALAAVEPQTLRATLPAFDRMLRVLDEQL